MKKDRSRDKIEAMKYNLSLSLSFLPVIHDTRGGSANRVDHVRRNHYHWSSSLSLLSSHSLSSRPSTRIELSANCHRGRRSRGRKIVNTRIRSFLWHRDLSLSFSLSSFVLVSKISKLVGFREEQACDENDYFCTNKNSLILWL